MNECTDKLALNVESIIVSTALMWSRIAPKLFHVWDFPTVIRVQHTCCSGAHGLRPILYTNIAIILFVYGVKTMEQHHGGSR